MNQGNRGICQHMRVRLGEFGSCFGLGWWCWVGGLCPSRIAWLQPARLCGDQPLILEETLLAEQGALDATAPIPQTPSGTFMF
jgi:hypothetical protein